MPDSVPSVPNTIPFDLDGLADLARQANPAVAQQVDSELGTTPEAPVVDENPQPVESAPVVEKTEPEATEPEPQAEIEEPSEPEKPSGETSIAEELEAMNRQKAEPAPKAIEKPKEEPAPKAAETAPNPRDADLKLDERAATAMHPKTKKIIEERNQKIIAERNKAETIAKEKEALAAELAKAREEAKKTAVPKEIEEELTTLRQRIREIDINQDPQLATKYDKPVQENEGQILKVLGEFGLGKTTKGEDDPAAIEALKQNGLNYRTLTPLIKKLRDAEEYDAAKRIERLLDKNVDLQEAKQREISEWKVDYNAKRQQAQQMTLQQQEKTQAEVTQHAQRILNSDIAELAKEFPFVNRPAEPVPTDSPAVSRAKQEAIAAYDAAAKSIGEAVAQLDPSKVSPDKVSEVTGRVTASAVQGIILRQHVLPRLAKDLAELKARNAELEAKVGKIKTAGTLSRAHAAAAASPSSGKTALPESNEDAAKQIAKEMGLALD